MPGNGLKHFCPWLSGLPWHKVVVYTFLLILPFIVFYWQFPFVSDKTIGNDYISCWVHEQMELQYSLRHGTFPLFVPGFAGGQTASALTLGQMYHPISHLSAHCPGYWYGKEIHWNTFWRLFGLGLAHLFLYILLCRIGLRRSFSFIISFITVYNFRMLDLFRNGPSLENYTAYLFLCTSLGFYYLKPTKITGPVSIIVSTYLLVCGGQPQMMYLGFLGVGIAAIAIPLILGSISEQLKVSKKKLIKYVLTGGICIITGISLASIYTVPFYFDFLRNNALRVGQNYKWSLVFSDSIGGALNSFFSPWNSDIHGAFGSSSVIILIAIIPFLFLLRHRIPWPVMVLWAITALIFMSTIGAATPVHYWFWKYFPFAQDFRVPGRNALLFPFLFLLIMAWIFRGTGIGKVSETKLVGNGNIKSLMLVFFAIPIYIFYHWFLKGYLPKPGAFTPAKINPHPQWLGPIMFWLGLITLVLVALYVLIEERFKRFPNKNKWVPVIGSLFAIAVVLQVTIEFRYGVWIEKQPVPITLVKLDKQKKRGLTSYREACYGLESKIVFDQMRRSFVDPCIGKFYRNYKPFTREQKVIRFLNKENITRTLGVEDLDKTLPKAPNSVALTDTEDAIRMEESSFNRVVFSLDAKAPGIFTLSYPFSGNWKAYVDGNPAPLYKVNGYMHGVFVETGKKQLEFRYWSNAAFVGVLISCLTVVLIGLYFGIFVFRNKRKWQIIIVLLSLMIPAGFFRAWFAGLYAGDNLGTGYTWTSDDFPPGNNLAYGKKTKMIPWGESFKASRGVDGRLTKPSFRTPPSKKGWWQVDLGFLKSVGEIVIYDGAYQGQKHLPLNVFGSRDGKTFKLLKTVAVRGTEYPWHITMTGDSVRFVRLQSSKTIPIIFNEVQIFPSTNCDGYK